MMHVMQASEKEQLGRETAWLLAEKYKGRTCEAFSADLARLEAGEPLAYVIGTIPFLDTVIHLDSRPLIPRVETEWWVESAIRVMEGAERAREAAAAPPLRALDLCAGSGAIGVAIQKSLPKIIVDTIELDPHHHDTIVKNFKTNDCWNENAEHYIGDLFSPTTHTYDFILSNPPYVDPALDRVETAAKNHEPHLALYGGKGGLDIIETIIAEAPKHLNPNGQLWPEHEPEQSTKIQSLATTNGFKCTTQKDQYGIERYSIITR